MSLCVGCMTEKGNATVCPKCGLNEAEIENSNTAFLRPHTMLNNRYIIGIALGQGGFGITYIGYDTVLNTKVAIKEYYPSDIAGRTSSDGTVSAFTNSKEDYYKGHERFLDEARTLAKFAEHPCIVGVKDCFNANNTAYMVMEFLDGVSLKEYIRRKGGKLDVQSAIALLTPVIDALKAVHKEGIIHRDISPDNIFITIDGRVRLIDFGAARQSFGGQKSLSIMLKPGYAPEEQYRTRGNQGPWTDVYALTATLYRMIVGSVPPDSLERVMQDTLVIPEYLPGNIKTVFKNGLAVRAHDRYADINQLQIALGGGKVEVVDKPENSVSSADGGKTTADRVQQIPPQGGGYQPYPQRTPQGEYRRVQQNNNTRTALIAAISVMSVILVAVVVFVIIVASGNSGNTNVDVGTVTTVQTQTEEAPPPPVFTSVSASAARKSTSSNKYYAELAADGNTSTAWNVTGGPGQWIQFAASTEQLVKGIKILNGYTKFSDKYNMWLYYPNSRAKDVEISFGDGSSISYTLQDTFDQNSPMYQTIDFGGYKKTTWVKIKINSVYKGNKWNDCCISEVQFY